MGRKNIFCRGYGQFNLAVLNKISKYFKIRIVPTKILKILFQCPWINMTRKNFNYKDHNHKSYIDKNLQKVLMKHSQINQGQKYQKKSFYYFSIEKPTKFSKQAKPEVNLNILCAILNDFKYHYNTTMISKIIENCT